MGRRAQVPEVLLMAGGEGRRLGHLTAQTPKPMLPVGGRPLIELIIEQLRDQGVRHVVVSVRHLAHVVVEHLGDGTRLGVHVEYVHEDRPLGTAGAVGLVPASDLPLLVLNADLVMHVPVRAMLARHRALGAAMTVGLVDQVVRVPFGVVDCSGSQLLDVREKPDLPVTVMGGVYLLSPEVVAAVTPGEPMMMPDLVRAFVGTRRVVGFALAGPWMDIGSPDAYAEAGRLLPQVRSHAAAHRT